MDVNEKFDDIDRKIYALSRPLYLANQSGVALLSGSAELFRMKALAAVRWGTVQVSISVPQTCKAELVFYDSAGEVCYRSGEFNLVQGDNSVMSLFYYKGNDEVTVKLESTCTFSVKAGGAVAIINGAR